MGRGDMPEERHLRTIASAPLSEQAAVWTKQKPKKGQTAGWCAIANSLMKRQMFARDAKFGEKEEAAFWGGKPGKGSRRALRRPAKRGGQRGLFHAPCPRCEGVRPAPVPAPILRLLSLRSVPTSPRRAAR